MEKAGNIAIKRKLLRWLMNATLVISVFAFSGHVSQSKSPSSEPARTELKQSTSSKDEKTVRFKALQDASGHFAFFDQLENFNCRLYQFENQIEVKLKANIGSCTIKDQPFLIHYFTYNSEVPYTDKPRG